jgi:hypothetical protein
MALPIAHHSLLLAIPFVVPMLVVVLGLLAMVVRDRIKGDSGAA